MADHLSTDQVAGLIQQAGGTRPMARLLGISPSTVERWRAGDRRCPAYIEAAVAELLRRQEA